MELHRSTTFKSEKKNHQEISMHKEGYLMK